MPVIEPQPLYLKDAVLTLGEGGDDFQKTVSSVTFVPTSTTATSTGMPWLSEASEKVSGRMPRVRDFSFGALARTSRGTGTTKSPTRTPPSATWPWMRFMAGEPMKPATNRLAGVSYSASGESTCCRTPSFMTATRSPIVMASTWSWVT